MSRLGWKMCFCAGILALGIGCGPEAEPEEDDSAQRAWDAMEWLNDVTTQGAPPSPTAGRPSLSSWVAQSWFESPGAGRVVTGQDIFYDFPGAPPSSMSLLVSLDGVSEYVEISQWEWYGPTGYPWRLDFYSANVPKGDYPFQLQLKTAGGEVSAPMEWLVSIVAPGEAQEVRPYAGMTCDDIVGLYPVQGHGWVQGCHPAQGLLCFSETGAPVCSADLVGRCVSQDDLSAHLDGLTELLGQRTMEPTWDELPTVEPAGC